MKILVNAHKCEIEKSPVNEKEINVTKVEFEFSEEITNEYVKDVYFTLDNETIQMTNIQNNECDIPYEVLAYKGQIEIGVVAYLIESDEYVKRYNPSPVYIQSWIGSLKEKYDNTEEITPSDKEQLEQELNDGLQEISEAVSTITTAVEQANTMDLDVSKSGKIATVELTKKDGTIKTVTLSDGTNLEFNWNGTSLGIKTDEDADYTYVDLQGVQGEQGPMGAPFTIKKTYSSVAEMNADFNNMNVGDYVMITSSVEVEDNAKLYCKGTEAWIFITDFSGATGIQGPTGATPNIQIGTVSSGETPSVTRTGTNENPVLNFVLEKGETGQTGQTGATGNGIASIEKTSTSGVNDLYTITYTNGQTTTFIVTNGEVSLEQLNYYRMIENALPKVTGAGTNITLNNTAETPLKLELEPSELSQKTTAGKNLLPTQVSYWESGQYDTNGAKIASSTRMRLKNLLPVEPNTTYYVGKTLILRTFNSSQQFQSSIGAVNAESTFTTGSNDYYLGVTLNTAIGNYDENTNQVSIMLNSVSDKSWEQYTNGPSPNPTFPQTIHTVTGNNTITISNSDNTQSQILTLTLGDLEYCKIGDYKDEFYKATSSDIGLQEGKWYLKKNIDKTTLNGSESSWLENSALKGLFQVTLSNVYANNNTINVKSNMLIGETNNNITGSTIYVDKSIATASTNRLFIRMNSYRENIEGLTTFLSTNNLIVYFITTLPTYIPLNDTLQTELDNIYEWAKAYQNQTNISQTNADLPFIINGKAIRDMSNIFDLINEE